MSRLSPLLVLAFATLAAAGCGGDEQGAAEGEAESEAESESEAEAESESEAESEGECANAAECPDGRVCVGGACESDVPCDAGDDCGPGGVCNADTMLCQPNMPGGPCEIDDECLAGETCKAGFCGCGGKIYEAENVAPNMLIVLDRSGSMNDEIGGVSKWDIAREAISDILAEFGDQIRFGLMLFPGLSLDCSVGAECEPGTVFVGVDPDTAELINGALDAADTCSFGTPITATVESLIYYLGLEDTERPNYVLLITDGMDSCETDPSPAVAALAAETPPVLTFVVGFGGGVDPSELSEMAMAGGTALPGDPPYYQADDAVELDAGLTAIAGSVLSCSYELSAEPPDGDALYVYFDDVEVLRDETHVDGWDYDEATNQMTFYGPACDLLQSGEVGELLISYGCPPPVE